MLRKFDGKYHTAFVVTSILFQATTKFWKSVRIFSMAFYFGTRWLVSQSRETAKSTAYVRVNAPVRQHVYNVVSAQAVKNSNNGFPPSCNLT